jgi:hypothetical protein
MARRAVVVVVLGFFGRASTLRVSTTSLGRREALVSSCAAATLLAAPHTAIAAAPALSAQRFSFEPRITPLIGGLSELGYSKFEDQLITPKGASNPSVNIAFEFPSQWAQLPPKGQITLVDGNSGLKVYVLTAPLPGPLAEVPKAWFGDAIFGPEGSIARGGTAIDEYKVSSAKLVENPADPTAPPRRRLNLKYSVITPANQRLVDRRAVASVYEVEGQMYAILASATASKWKDTEESRCERVVDTFVVGPA